MNVVCSGTTSSADDDDEQHVRGTGNDIQAKA